MTGYPESLTDPSYRGQILVPTYPMIGNYGVPVDDERDGISKFFESDKIHCKALVISDYSSRYSHWNSQKSLGDWLKEQQIPGLFGIDTRALTQKLRDHGAMWGKILFDDEDIIKQYYPALKRIRAVRQTWRDFHHPLLYEKRC